MHFFVMFTDTPVHTSQKAALAKETVKQTIQTMSLALKTLAVRKTEQGAN